MEFKISKKWNCIKTFDELRSDAKFIFIGKGWENLTPRIVLNTPINGIDCIEISYDRFGLKNGSECVFSENWGEGIEDSSKDVETFLCEFLKKESAFDLFIKKSKLIELTPECIKYWAKKAIDEGTSFKPCVEAYLEREAKSNSFEKTEVRGAKKNKNK